MRWRRPRSAAALESFDGVLALGGGAILAEATRAALRRPPVVYLVGRAVRRGEPGRARRGPAAAGRQPAGHPEVPAGAAPAALRGGRHASPSPPTAVRPTRSPPRSPRCSSPRTERSRRAARPARAGSLSIGQWPVGSPHELAAREQREERVLLRHHRARPGRAGTSTRPARSAAPRGAGPASSGWVDRGVAGGCVARVRSSVERAVVEAGEQHRVGGRRPTAATAAGRRRSRVAARAPPASDMSICAAPSGSGPLST